MVSDSLFNQKQKSILDLAAGTAQNKFKASWFIMQNVKNATKTSSKISQFGLALSLSAGLAAFLFASPAQEIGRAHV